MQWYRCDVIIVMTSLHHQPTVYCLWHCQQQCWLRTCCGYCYYIR